MKQHHKPSLLVWTAGGSNDPSARLRALCYQSELAEISSLHILSGFSLSKVIRQFSVENLEHLAKLFSCKNIFLQRRIPPMPLLLFWRLMGRRIIFDVDDGIHLYTDNNGQLLSQRLEIIAKYFDLVIVGNENLAHVWRVWNKNVTILPTAIYISEELPEKAINANVLPPLLWIGTSSNFHHLNIFLRWYLCSDIQNELIICSDRIPDEIGSSKKKIRFIQWSEQVEHELAECSAIGIMPLDENDLTAKFKCSFKMLQYMSWGLPVVVSPIGMNADILRMGKLGSGAQTSSEWHAAIQALSSSPESYKQQGKNGMFIAKMFFSQQAIFNKLSEILCSHMK